MPRERQQIRDFPGKRWLNLSLRTVHLVGLVLFGAALLGSGSLRTGAAILFFSGLLMFAIDLWASPTLIREVAGFGIIVKLALLAIAGTQPETALAVFWLVLVLSTVISHSSGAFRHRRLF
jgi:hypothetical protein